MDENYRQLDVWKTSVALTTQLYEKTCGFPDSERNGLAAEIRKHGGACAIAPFDANHAAPIATVAIGPDTRAIALLTAEPIPASVWSIPARIAAVSGATVIERPRENRRIPGSTSVR